MRIVQGGKMDFFRKKTHTQNVCCSLLFWYLNCGFVLFLFKVKFCPTSIKFIQKNVLTIQHHISLIKSPIKMHLFHIVDDIIFSQASQSLNVGLRTKLKWPIFIKLLTWRSIKCIEIDSSLSHWTAMGECTPFIALLKWLNFNITKF